MDEREAVSKCDICGEWEEACECQDCPNCGEKTSPSDICERCEECRNSCCSCFYCSCCDRTYDSDDECQHCGTCRPRCCDCIICSNCGDRCNDNYCGECDYCCDCCSCQTCGVKITDGHPGPFKHAKRNQHKDNPSRRLIALEVECSGVEKDYPNAIDNCVYKHGMATVLDGSVPAPGFEINTCPASGDLFVEQIRELSKALHAQDATVSSSCGLHCHVDASDYGWTDLRRLIKLYAVMEDGMFRLAGRGDNHYAKACADHYLDMVTASAPTVKATKERMIRDNWKAAPRDFRYIKGEKYNSSRYYALNLHSWAYRKTIEFRHHKGTTLRSKMIPWGMLCARIVDTAYRLSDAQVASLTAAGAWEAVTAGVPMLEKYTREGGIL